MIGYRCPLCYKVEGEGKSRFVNHHVQYPTKGVKEIRVRICLQCHLRLHGTGRVFGHRLDKEYGKAIGPYEFSRRVCMMYEYAWDKADGIVDDTIKEEVCRSIESSATSAGKSTRGGSRKSKGGKRGSATIAGKRNGR